MYLPFAWPETSQRQKSARTDFVNEGREKNQKKPRDQETAKFNINGGVFRGGSGADWRGASTGAIEATFHTGFVSWDTIFIGLGHAKMKTFEGVMSNLWVGKWLIMLIRD